MYSFNYHRVTSTDEAVSLHASSDEASYLAGGMTLIPTLKQRLAAPSDVIDLGGIDELKGIDSENGNVRVGGLTTHSAVAASSSIPALARLAGGIGDPQVRNCGTIGGSIANNDPAADYPAAVVGLGATIQTTSRSISGDDFFQGLFETALEENEIVTSVSFPVPHQAAYVKFPNPASRYAIVGVMVAVTDSGVRVGVTGAGPCAFRATAFEEALTAELSPASLEGVQLDSSDFNVDLHASAEYRAHLATVMAQRAVAEIAG